MTFVRRIKATARDLNRELLTGAKIYWYVDNEPAGSGSNVEGSSTLEIESPHAVVSVAAEYSGRRTNPVRLSQEQTLYEFTFNVESHPRWSTFTMKHFPALVGIVFILIGVALSFLFPCASSLQTRLILAMFALGAGGFAGEIAGLIKTELNLGTKLRISAAGGLAVFVVLFFYEPAGSPVLSSEPCAERTFEQRL